MFGDAIKSRREQKGLTQGELGRLAGLDAPTISRIEKGERWFSRKSLAGLARALDLEPRLVPMESCPDSAAGVSEPPPPYYGADKPVRDKRLASLIAWIVETWEAATEFDRGQWHGRFIAAFPEAKGGAENAPPGGGRAGLAGD